MFTFSVTDGSCENRKYLNHSFSFLQDRMTVHRDKFLLNETNRHTEFQFYWYYDSTCIGQPFCPSLGVLLSLYDRFNAILQFWLNRYVKILNDW